MNYEPPVATSIQYTLTKMGASMTLAAITLNVVRIARLPTSVSIFRAEPHASFRTRCLALKQRVGFTLNK